MFTKLAEFRLVQSRRTGPAPDSNPGVGLSLDRSQWPAGMPLAGRAQRRCAARRLRRTRCDGPRFRLVVNATARPQPGAGRIDKGTTWTKDLVVPPPTAPVPRREPVCNENPVRVDDVMESPKLAE